MYVTNTLLLKTLKSMKKKLTWHGIEWRHNFWILLTATCESTVYTMWNPGHFTTLHDSAVTKWIRHCATSGKVAGSRSDEVNELFKFI
jgi:hypothetical protein